MAVLCPACKAENPPGSRQCAQCGGRLVRKARRRSAPDGAAVQTQASDLGSGVTRAAFRCAVVGLIPGAGLVLGPVAVVLSLLAYRREKAGPPRKGRSPALAVLALAAGVVVTNWVGVLLMIYGLTTAGRG